MGKLRELENRLRVEMREAGCAAGEFRCCSGVNAAEHALDDQISAIEEQIADSRRMLGTLAGSGFAAVVLILVELLRIRQFINSFDIAIVALCAADLGVCLIGAVAELRKIANARAENDPA